MDDNIKKRDWLKKLRKMKDNDLEKLYMETNTIISKYKGQSHIGMVISKPHHRILKHAQKTRARVLTVMNQRRHERTFRKGGL